jgi:hypothetical protein
LCQGSVSRWPDSNSPAKAGGREGGREGGRAVLHAMQDQPMAWRCRVWLYMPFTCEILAGCRSASPRAWRCWLPAWLPGLSLAWSTCGSPRTHCLAPAAGQHRWPGGPVDVACGQAVRGARGRCAGALAVRHDALYGAFLDFHARPGGRDRRGRWPGLGRRVAQRQCGLVMGHGAVIRMPA